MEHSIKLKYSGEPLSASDALQAIASVAGVDLVRCVRIQEGYRAVVASAEDLTPFLSTAGQARFIQSKFTIMPSPELRAKCTVLAKKLDKTVVTRPVAAIRDAIQYTNGVKIDEVYIPPDSQLAKIRCSSPEDAHKLLKGFMLFNTSVPHYNVKPEEYIRLDHCYRCYSLDHLKSACTRTQITCSRCAQEGHFYADCTRPFKCKLCGGGHSAISGLCPTRRAKLKILREHNKQNNMPRITTSQNTTTTITTPHNTTNQNTTFAQAVQPRIPAILGNTNNTQHNVQQTQHIQHTQTPTPPLTHTDTGADGCRSIDKIELITTCITTAHALWGKTTRRTLATKIHEILQANNLQDVVIPEGWLDDTPLEAGASPPPITVQEIHTTPETGHTSQATTDTVQHQTTKTHKRRITPPQSSSKRAGKSPSRNHPNSPADTAQSESDYGDSDVSFVMGTDRGVHVHASDVKHLVKWTTPCSPRPRRRKPARLKKSSPPPQVEHVVHSD